MKNAKKLASIILAIVMVLAMAIPAFAANDGKITIDNALVGKTYTIYKILDLESFNKDTGAYSYKPATDWADFFKTFTDENGDKAANYVDINAQDYVTWKTDADVAAFAKLAQKYAKAKNITNQGSTEAATTTVEFTSLELGYYLLDTNLGTLCSLDTTDKEVTIKEKNAEPTNEKEVKEDTFGKTNDATIGDTVEFQSTITAQAGAESYVFHDKMSDGLTYGSVTSVTLNGTAVDAANYTVANTSLADDCDFEVTFTQAFCDTLEDNDKIVISYTATLNDKALIGDEEGNLNKSFIKYGENGKFTTTPSETKTFTWKFDVFKYTLNDKDEKIALAGAKFTLSKNADGSDPIGIVADTAKDEDGVVAYRVDTTSATKEITTTDTGKFSINGLDSGTYYLTETAAPDGYNKLDKAVKVVIDKDGKINVTDDNANGVAQIEVENNTGSELPSTGGIGTTIFYVVGSLLLAGAAVLLIAKKRMSAER